MEGGDVRERGVVVEKEVWKRNIYEVPRKGPVPYSGPQRDFFAPFLDRYFTTQWSTIRGPSPIAVHAPITVHGT